MRGYHNTRMELKLGEDRKELILRLCEIKKERLSVGSIQIESVLLVRTMVNGVLFTSDLVTPFVEIAWKGEIKQTVKVDSSVRLKSQGDLERFAVELYYLIVLNHRVFGGREIKGSYEIV